MLSVWAQDMELMSFVKGVFISLFTGAVVWVIKLLVLACLHRRSPYTGEWVDTIYNSRDEIVKQDRLTLRHNPRTHVVRGKIRRRYPDEQSNKKWKVNGVIMDNYMALVFWSKDPTCCGGCIYVIQIEPYRYDGYYIRCDDNGRTDIVTIKLGKKGMSGSVADLLGW